jgi:hypothetical protein
MNVGDLIRVKEKNDVFIFPTTGIDLRKDTPRLSPGEFGIVIGHRIGPGNMSWVNIFTSGGLNGWIPTHKLEKVSGA